MKLTQSHQDKLRLIRSHVAKGLSLSALLTFGTTLTAADATPRRLAGVPPMPSPKVEPESSEQAPMLGQIAPRVEEIDADSAITFRQSIVYSLINHRVHSLEPGDNLLKIARLYYSDVSRVHVRLLSAVNRDIILHPEAIKPGTPLIIPVVYRVYSKQPEIRLAGDVCIPYDATIIGLTGSDTQLHTVGKGETLVNLAKKYYHHDGEVYLDIIRQANADIIAREKGITPGTQLVIPSINSAKGELVFSEYTHLLPPEPEFFVSKTDSQLHTVQMGETCAEVSVRYYRRATPETLAIIVQANRDQISHPDQVREGMKLVIPTLIPNERAKKTVTP